MKNHGLRRIFSLFLALFMVFTLLPTTALAEDTTEADETQPKPVVVDEGEKKTDPSAPEDPKTFTVTYTDGANSAVFPNQVSNLPAGTATPAFSGTLEREGYTFAGWNPAVAGTVTADVTYVAQWKAVVPGRNALTLPTIPGPDVAPAALNTGHKIDVTFTVLYVSDEFNLGYNYGSSEKTKFVCQYSSNHSDTAYNNHTIAISDIKAAAGRASVNSGYQIVGWSKESNANPTTWSLNKSGTTACNKGTTIYLVAKNPNPTTKYTYTLNYDANGGTGAPSADSWSTTDASIRYHSFTVKNTIPTREGYVFKGWKAKDGADTIYAGGALCSVSQQGNDVVKNGNTWTRTLYAVWEEAAPAKPKWQDFQYQLRGDIVHVTCVNPVANHPEKYYPWLSSNDDRIGEVKGSAGSYTCTVTVDLGYYLGKYDRDVRGEQHSYVQHSYVSPITADILLKYEDGEWVVDEASLPIEVKLTCNTTPKPDKPNKPSNHEVKTMLHYVVEVDCINTAVNHRDMPYPLLDNSFTVSDVQGSASPYTCTVTVNAPAYVTKYDGDVGGTHTLSDDASKTITLKYDGRRWAAQTTTPIVFKVMCDAQPMPDKPTAPGKESLSGLIGQITVNCTNEAATHDPKSKSYALISGSYTTGEVEGDAENGYTYTVTINSQKYVEQFDTDTGAAHTPKDAAATVTLKHTDNGWAVERVVPVVFNVACVTEIVPPAKPGAGDLAKLEAPVEVACTTKPETHAAAHFSLGDGTYTIGDVAGNKTDGYTCDITVTADRYVWWYNLDYGKHTLTGDNTKTLTLKYVEGQWAVDTPVTFPVECGTAPQKPTPPTDEIEGATVAVKCITGHGDLSWKIGSSTFTVGEVTGDDTTGYTCTVTVQAEVYVNAFNSNKKANGVKHTLADDAEKTFTMTYVNGAWTGPTNPAVTFEVKCEEELVPVHLVIYRNGDTSKAYKDVALESQPKGHVIDLSTIDIADYYTGNYEFYGWYDDGLFNIYKSDPANPPAGLKEKTVNGWTNLKCMVYDKYQVVYFQSEEAWRDFQNDHSKTEGRLYSTTALFGSTLPTADAPTPTRTGYTFKFWSREGQNGDVTGQTVNGWTNLYAVWEKNIYTVTYTDGVNGEAFADQVYNVPFEDATPAFDGTPARAGYKFLGWEPTVAETVTENATYVAQWEKLYTVTYTDGVDEKVFKDDVHSDLEKDTPTPAFSGGTPTRKGFVFDGWNPEVAETVTEDVTYTAQWKPVQPDKKAIEGAIGRGVAVVCDNQNVNHGEKKYKPTLGEYTVSDVMGTAADGYTCTVTVKAAKFIEKYNSDMGDAVHTLIAGEPAEKTIELKWNGEKWVAETELPVTFHTLCPPEQPSKKDIEGAIGRGVRIVCDNQNVNHWAKDYKPTQGEYTVSDVTGTASEGYTCTITVKAAKIVEKYGSDFGKPHDLIIGEAAEKTVELKWDGEKWVAKTELPITFHVECPPEKPTYDDLKELGIDAKVHCATTTAHTDATYALIGGTYEISDPARKGTVYTCTLTVKAKDYVAKYNAEENVGPHTLDDRDSKTIELTWNGEKWTAAETRVTFNVKCELLTVTYTDGVKGEEVFEDVVYNDIPYGTNTPAFGTKDPTRKGYKFLGWEPVVADTVTENATYVAQWEKLYTVTYTDGAKGKAFKDQVYSDLESGADTPKFDGKPTRKGYTFTGWSPKVTDTVTKDVTYVAQWKSVKNGKDNIPKTGDSEIVMVLGSVLLFSFCGAAAVSVYDRKRKHF